MASGVSLPTSSAHQYTPVRRANLWGTRFVGMITFRVGEGGRYLSVMQPRAASSQIRQQNLLQCHGEVFMAMATVDDRVQTTHQLEG